MLLMKKASLKVKDLAWNIKQSNFKPKIWNWHKKSKKSRKQNLITNMIQLANYVGELDTYKIDLVSTKVKLAINK